MTAATLNAQFAEILEQISVQISRFDKLREEVSDETWDQATEELPLGDLLCDLEYETERAMEQALQAWARTLPR